MFKKMLLILSYISLSSQMFMTPPHFFSPFKKNANASIPHDYPILESHEIAQKRTKCDDALIIFRIWATLFIFTFPAISFPYHKEN